VISGPEVEALAAILRDALANLDDGIERQARRLASERVRAVGARRAADAHNPIEGSEEDWLAYNHDQFRRLLAQMEDIGELWRRRLIHDAEMEDAARLAAIPPEEWTATVASLVASIATSRVNGRMDHVRVHVR